MGIKGINFANLVCFIDIAPFCPRLTLNGAKGGVMIAPVIAGTTIGIIVALVCFLKYWLYSPSCFYICKFFTGYPFPAGNGWEESAA
jgi:hypothetical protein